MLSLMLLVACTAGKDDSAAPDPATLTLLTPSEGDVVAAGAVSVAVVVEDFLLVDPAKHNDGSPEGYLQVRLDGADVLTTGATTFTVEDVAAGAHTLEVELYYADGDALEPPVSASVGFTAAAE